MQVSVESTSGLERKLTLAIPAEQIDTEVQKRLADAAKKIRLDGFRPGKVPRKVVQQRFGAALRDEVVGEVANQSFQQAVSQESLTPVGTPAIDFTKNEAGHDLEIVATFEVFPEIKPKLSRWNSFEKSEIEILAIGIGHDVSRYYDKAIKITDVNELGDVMISQLSSLFESKAFLG